ncbi:MAG: hypothetical protein ACYC6G_05120 [Desulfobaccales bacterium]
MKRDLVSSEDLLKWLNLQLTKELSDEESAVVRFYSITPLREEDEYGCNWSDAVLRCSGCSSEGYKPIAAQILAQARSKFNLK